MSDQTHSELLKQLTLMEKAKLCSGADFWHLQAIDRLGLPSIMVTDGPHGLRKQPDEADHLGISNSVPATCFPTASGLAASWNRELIHSVGVALGEECRTEKVSVLLGPGVNIKRNPLGGRNFEYFSEDPYVSGELASAWIKGVQSQGIGSSLKHYAVNNHEAGRMVVDAVVDERTLREIYLPGFEITVKQSNPWTIMCSYNKLEGVYLSENKRLLTDILRHEWGFSGLVVTDWGATHDRVQGIRAGQDLEMPSSGMVNTSKILAAIEDGTLQTDELDLVVGRVLNLILTSKQGGNDDFDYSKQAHHELAKQAAIEACVLLKNENATLPLKSSDRIVVIGALAKEPRYQGSGSSQINPTRLVQPLDAINQYASDHGVEVAYADGYLMTGEASEGLITEAVEAAESADKVILIAGLTPEYESEGFDRSHLNIPQGQLDLISALKGLHQKVILVLQNGAPVTFPESNAIPSILEVYLGGQAGALALVDILFGLSNPSGKLAETFPLELQDIPSQSWFPGETRQSQYREGIWVGYRYFNTIRKPVAYPFGHGLSYTTFEYSDLRIDAVGDKNSEEPFNMKEADQLEIKVTIKNTGDCRGAEIVQIYVGQTNASVHRPARELKGFEKVMLEPGEMRQVTIHLDHRSFAFWHCDENSWVVESDEFTISAGASVEDIRLTQDISLKGDRSIGKRSGALTSYFNPESLDFNDQVYAALLQRTIPEPLPSEPFQMNSTLLEVEGTWLGRQLRNLVRKMMLAQLGDISDHDRRMFDAITAEMPLRGLVAHSQGKLSEKLMCRLIHCMNGDWLKFLKGTPVKSE
ncbi:MAG TPA: glycosyl hydrolase [Pseudomonadales bacterium]|nr:glycosyl hydrolase [Pseudomonadales bacterium]